jgi:hypothetical protein
MLRILMVKGLIFGPTGAAMSPAHTRRKEKALLLLCFAGVLKRDADTCPIRRLPAAEIESAVIDQVRGHRAGADFDQEAGGRRLVVAPDGKGHQRRPGQTTC